MTTTKTLIAFSMLAGAAVLTGCASAEDPSLEGISFSGGNSQKQNTALQMVDPWPQGVQDTNLVVPASSYSQGEVSTDSTPENNKN